MLFVSSRFVPAFSHTRGVGGTGRTVAVRMLRTSPSVASVVVSKIPTLAWQYGASTPWAGDLLAGRHALRPSCALPLVRAPVATLRRAAALMVASALVLTAVALTVGHEAWAAGVGAASHILHTPLPFDCVRGSSPCVPVTPVRGHPTLGPARRPTLGRVPSTHGRNHEELEGTGRPRGAHAHDPWLVGTPLSRAPVGTPREKTVASGEPRC